MSDGFEISDKVYVSNPTLSTHGCCGIVTGIVFRGGIRKLKVTLSKTTILIKPSNLIKADSDLTTNRTKTEKGNQKYLAFVHFHEEEYNPTSIEEACDQFSMDELGSPELTLYGTKDEISDSIIENHDHSSCEKVFIILGNEVYPVKFKMEINW